MLSDAEKAELVNGLTRSTLRRPAGTLSGAGPSSDRRLRQFLAAP